MNKYIYVYLMIANFYLIIMIFFFFTLVTKLLNDIDCFDLYNLKYVIF